MADGGNQSGPCSVDGSHFRGPESSGFAVTHFIKIKASSQNIDTTNNLMIRSMTSMILNNAGGTK
jgi:hypothetical protein